MRRIELAREEDEVRGRSGGGAGGARLQPNREVRIASSESWTPGGIGDDRELSVVGVAGGSSRWSAMEGVGRVTVARVARRLFIWVEVCSTILEDIKYKPLVHTSGCLTSTSNNTDSSSIALDLICFTVVPGVCRGMRYIEANPN